jgi:hypothetical protein
LSDTVNQYFLSLESVNYFAKVFTKSIARDAISQCGNSKLVTAVDELKGPECGNGAEETEKSAEVEKSDCVDEDVNKLEKRMLSKRKLRSCLNMMKYSNQPDEDATLIE